MRREPHDSHAAHRDAQHKQAQDSAHEEPLKRSYERVVSGEKPVDDATDDALPPDQPTAAEPGPAAAAQPSAAEIEAEVAQEMAATSGSSPAKYGSLKGKDHNN